MIEIIEGFWIDPDKVSAVKSAGKDKCVLFMDGQTALEGYFLDYPAQEVVQVIEDYFSEDGEEEDGEED